MESFGINDFPSMSGVIGSEGFSSVVRDDEEWGVPDDPDDYYYHLMVDWYFETIDIKLTLQDHEDIRVNTVLYSKNNALYYPSARMEARLHGLRTLLAPTAVPDESSRKQRYAHRTIEVDGIVFTTRDTPPCVRPNTRGFSRLKRFADNVSPNLLDDDDDALTSSRSGLIESGGE